MTLPISVMILLSPAAGGVVRWLSRDSWSHTSWVPLPPLPFLLWVWDNACSHSQGGWEGDRSQHLGALGLWLTQYVLCGGHVADTTVVIWWQPRR